MSANVQKGSSSSDTRISPQDVVAGMPCEFFYRRRWRAAKVLAVRGQEALIEYQMGQASRYRILWLPSLDEAYDRDRPVRFDELSTAWLESLAA